jgi:hypothetical protein
VDINPRPSEDAAPCAQRRSPSGCAAAAGQRPRSACIKIVWSDGQSGAARRTNPGQPLRRNAAYAEVPNRLLQRRKIEITTALSRT